MLLTVAGVHRRYLFNDCLFSLPTVAVAEDGSASADVAVALSLPKCKSAETRSAAFGLLVSLCRGSFLNTKEMHMELAAMVRRCRCRCRGDACRCVAHVGVSLLTTV
jgi:hypothetical protein